jgi:hypothetical protein
MQFTTHFEIWHSNPAAICHHKKMAEKVCCANWPVIVVELVMQFTTDHEIEGSNLDAACHHNNMAEKSFSCPLASYASIFGNAIYY